MFNLDYSKLILWLLPEFLRKPRQYAWLAALCKPVSVLYGQFIALRESNLYKLEHNSQMYSIQKVLNDRFDKNTRRIYLTDGFSYDRVYLYLKEENKPKKLGTIPLHNREDYGDSGLDFIVWVPNVVNVSSSDLYELKALVDFYKLASKRFRIYRI